MINIDAIIHAVCDDCKKAEGCRKIGRIPDYEVDEYNVLSPSENKEYAVPIVRAAWCDDKEKEEC